MPLPRLKSGRFVAGHSYSPSTQFKPGQHWRPPAVFRDKKYLIEQYVNRGRAAKEISEEHGVTENAILFWIKKHAIPTRSMREIRSKKKWGLSGSTNGMYGRRGPQSPSWKGGFTPERAAFYATIEWRRAVRSVRKRDRCTCQRCGTKDKLEIHHIASFSVKELRAVVSNLVMLCEGCHDFVHSKSNKGREFLA